MLQLENPVKTPVLGWIMAPKQANVLLPGTCEYVTFLGKKLFEQKITLRVLRQIILHYPGGSNMITRWMIRGRESEAMMEAKGPYLKMPWL